MGERIVVQMNENYSCEIIRHIGSRGEYYNFNGVNYDIRFPISWVFQIPVDEDTIFGPETCYDCFKNGYYNGVFVGYCCRCAQLVNYERGNGMISNGNERNGYEETSIWNLYLQNRTLEQIGDSDLFIEYRYKLCSSGYSLKNNNNDNDDITVNYDNFEYYQCLREDDITIAFSSSDDYWEDLEEEDDNDEMDSIS